MNVKSWIVSKSKIAPLRYVGYFLLVFTLIMLYCILSGIASQASLSWIKLPSIWTAVFWLSLAVGASLGCFLEVTFKLCVRTSTLKKILRIAFFILLLVAHHFIFLYANIDASKIYDFLLPILNGMGLPPNLAFDTLMHLFHLIKFPIIYYLIIGSEALWLNFMKIFKKDASS